MSSYVKQAIRNFVDQNTQPTPQTGSIQTDYVQSEIRNFIDNPTQYNQRTSQPAQQTQQWDTGRMLGKIYDISTYNPQKAQKLYGDFRYLQTQRDSKYYNPYIQPTNKAVSNIANYGINASKIDDEFFNNNMYLLQHLNYNGQTNTPSAPTKKSSNLERAAYEFYQLWIAEDATKKAEQQWDDLQKEIKYWAQRSDRNMSDEEILGRINWDKYSELSSMDNNKYTRPNEYNRAIGYSKDALYGVLWEARNPEFTGSMEEAMAYRYMGVGNKYQRDNDIAAKLTKGTPQYSPYEIGSTMDKQCQYFGVDHFDQKWLDQNAVRILNGSDETAKKYYEDIYNAVQFTNACNQELELMYKDIDVLLDIYDDPESIIDALEDARDDDNAKIYKNLFSLNDSFRTGNPKETSDKINYNWNAIQQLIRNKCAQKESASSNTDFTDNAVDGVTGENEEKAETDKPESQEPVKPEIKETITPTPTQPPVTVTEPKQDFVYKGNIDLDNRKIVQNEDGSFSTERSISFYDEDTGKEILVPTIIDGKIVTTDEAIDHYYETGEHLGMFDNPDDADSYATQLHEIQEEKYRDKSRPNPVTGVAPATPTPSPYDANSYVERYTDTATNPPPPQVTPSPNNTPVPQATPAPKTTQPPVNAPKPTPGPEATPAPKTTEKALDEDNRRNINSSASAIKSSGTNEEKIVYNAGRTSSFSEYVDKIHNAVANVSSCVKNMAKQAQKHIAVSYIPTLKTIGDYEDTQNYLAELEERRKLVNIHFSYLQARSNLTGNVNFYDASQINNMLQSNGWEEAKEKLQSSNPDDQFVGYAYVYNTLAQTGVFDGSFLNLGVGVDNNGNLTNIPDRLREYAEIALQGGVKNDSDFDPLTPKEEEYMQAYGEELERIDNEISNVRNDLQKNESAYNDAVAARDRMITDYKLTGDFVTNNGGKFYRDLTGDMDVLYKATKEYTPTTWSANTIYDEAIASKQATYDQCVLNAQNNILGYKAEIEQLTRALEAVNVFGVELSEEDRMNAEQRLAVLKRDVKSAGYFLMRNDKSIKPIATNAMKKGVTDDMSALTKANVDALLTGNTGDFTSDFLSSVFLGGDQFSQQFLEHRANNVYDSAITTEEISRMVSLITEDEKLLYFYLLETEGENAANDYFQNLADPIYGSLRVRSSEERSKELHDYAAKNGWTGALSYVGSFALNVVSNAQSWMTEKFHEIEGVEDNPYGFGHIASQATADLRAGVLDQLKAAAPGISEDVVDFFFNAITSAGDSTINALLTDGAFDLIGDMVPVLGKLASFMGTASEGQYGNLVKFGANFTQDLAHALPMGIGAAAKAYRDAIINHATPDQAKAIFMTTMFAETVSEALTYGNMKSLFAKGDSGEIKGLVKTLLSSGFEEALGEGFNQWWEDNAERTIMQERNEYNQMLSYYKDTLGLPASVAEDMVNGEMMKNIMIAAGSGFVSSMFSSTGAYVRGTAQSNYYRDVQQAESAMDQLALSVSKDMSTLGVAGNSGNATQNAIVIASVLRGGVQIHEANAASQHLITDICEGSTTTANATMKGVVVAAGENLQEAKSAVAFATLTKGEANARLKEISRKARSGEQITENDVDTLVTAAQSDKSGPNANIRQNEYAKAVIENRKAAETRDALAKPEVANALKAADNKVREAKRVQATMDENAKQKQAEADVAKQNAQDAVDTLIEDSSKQSLGPLEQTMNQAEAADRAAQEAQAQADAQAQKLEQAHQDAQALREEKLAAARQQAETKVNQEVQQEQAEAEAQAQAEFDNAVATYHPVKVYKKPVVVTDVNGNKVQIVGVFAQDANSGQFIFATKNGYIHEKDIDDYDLKNNGSNWLDHAGDNWQGDNGVNPQAWLGHSVKAIDNQGNEFEIVGFAGQMDGDPVLIDSNGFLHTTSGENKVRLDEADSAYIIDEYFDNGGDDMADISPEEIINNSMPDIEMPEGFVAYPGGPIVVTDKVGNEHEIVGVINDTESGYPLQYVDSNGLSIDSTSIQDEPAQFTQWLADMYGEEEKYTPEDYSFDEAPPEEDEIDEFYFPHDFTDEDVNEEPVYEGGDTSGFVPTQQETQQEEAPAFTYKTVTGMPNKVMIAPIYGELDNGTRVDGIAINADGELVYSLLDGNGFVKANDYDMMNKPFLEWMRENVSHLKETGEDITDDLINDANNYLMDQKYTESDDVIPNTGFNTQTEQQDTNENQDYLRPRTLNKEKKTKKGRILKLFDWQNAKYHGDVVEPKARWNPKTKKFKDFIKYDSLPEEAKRFVYDKDGNAIVYYRASGDFGDNRMYMEHKAPTYAKTPEGKDAYANFYGSNPEMVATYGNIEPVVTAFRVIKNWETAKAAMQDLGLDLIIAADPNGSGKIGYRVAKNYGNGPVPLEDLTVPWFAEEDIGLFRRTYGGNSTVPVLHAGYIDMSDPLILDANGNSYSWCYGDVTAPDGAKKSGYDDTDGWAKWAFQHGYKTLIVDNVRDNSGGGGVPMVDIITSSSEQFKSVYNDGNYSKKEDIMALKVNPGRNNYTPTQRQQKKVKKKLRSPQQIANDLIKSLGVGNYIGSNNFGNLSSDLRGYWERHAQLVAVKNRDMGDYTATLHEAGHAIAQKLGLTGTNQMVQQLIKETPQFAEAYSSSELKGEAFAEFVWRYMENEQNARDFAGDSFYDQFEKELLKDPGLTKAVWDARSKLQQFVNATLDERMDSIVRWSNSGQRASLRDLIRQGINMMVDTTSVADDIDAFIGQETGVRGTLRRTALFAKHAQKRALVNLTDHLTDAYGNIIGEGMAKRMTDVGFVGTEDNIHLLEKYMLYKHSIRRDEEGKPVFDRSVTLKERKDEIDRIERERQDIVRAAEAWQSFRRDFLQAWMVDTGFWTQELFDKLEATYPDYVPTFRIRNEEGKKANMGFSGGKKFSLKAATGGSEDIYSPYYSFIGMVNQISEMVANNQTAQQFDKLYNDVEGMGVFGRRIPGPVVSPSTAMQQRMSELLDGQVDEDIMEQVLNLIKSNSALNQTPQASNILTVHRENGQTVQYEIDNPELFKMLSGMSKKQNDIFFRTVGKLVRTMSMLTTGSNPLFAARNAVRDYQNSVNYGSWASDYATGLPKWIKSFYEVWRGSEDYENYRAMGGGGWTRIDQSNTQSMRNVQNEMFGDDKSNVGKTAKWLGKKVWNTITLARLNEIIEQTSRFAEYKYGKHDLNTTEGMHEAFQAAQDVTVDFSRSGDSRLADMLKKTVPFFNASLQGVYRTARQATEAERDRVGTRLAKTILNNALTSLLATGLILKFGDDDDKEEYRMMSDQIKAGHIILPNPLKGTAGQPPYLRIPLSQDPLAYAVHNLVTNLAWEGAEDELGISLAATADMILDNLNPLGSGTIAQPFLDVSHNRTWYGSNLIRTMMADWIDPSGQYNEDTPEVFKRLGNLFNASPEIVEYLFQQYTGFLGAMAIPALSINDNGEMSGLDSAIQAAIKKWTVDPTSSTDITKNFYNMGSVLETIKGEAESDRPQGLLLRSLTPEQTNQAYEEAVAMLSTGGLVNETKKIIKDFYAQIDKINANDELSDAEKNDQTRALRLKMLRQVQAANEQLEAYVKKYIQGETLTDRIFGGIQKRLQYGQYAHVKTDIEKLPEVFQFDAEDQEEEYMQRALSVYNGNAGSGLGGGKSEALPHPSRKFSAKNKLGKSQEVEITDDEDWKKYTQIYKQKYKQYVLTSSKGKRWKALTDEEKYTLLLNAARNANDSMKKAYLREHPVN